MIFAEFGVIRTFGLSVLNAGAERCPSKIFGVSGVQDSCNVCYCSYHSSDFQSFTNAYDILFPNLSFAALFQVEHSSYDSLVWRIRVFYLVVLNEPIVDWNIQTRLSGERPIIHGVRLSVAYTVVCPLVRIYNF